MQNRSIECSEHCAELHRVFEFMLDCRRTLCCLWISVVNVPSSQLICNNRWCSTSLLGRWSIAYQLSQGRHWLWFCSQLWSLVPLKQAPLSSEDSHWLAVSPAGSPRPQRTPAERGPPYWAERPSILSTHCNSLSTARRSCLHENQKPLKAMGQILDMVKTTPAQESNKYLSLGKIFIYST